MFTFGSSLHSFWETWGETKGVPSSEITASEAQGHAGKILSSWILDAIEWKKEDGYKISHKLGR
jgi:hypothetical protein